MDRYTHLLGKHIELVYLPGGLLPGLFGKHPGQRAEGGVQQVEQHSGARFAGMELFASGVLLGCSNEFILMEQRADQFGSIAKFALRVPHSWVLRLREDDRERRLPVPARARVQPASESNKC